MSVTSCQRNVWPQMLLKVFPTTNHSYAFTCVIKNLAFVPPIEFSKQR